MTGAYRALDEMRDTGVVTAIGLGINDCATAQRLLRELDLDVVLLAGRYTLLECGAAQSLLSQCEQRDVSVIIGSPFNSGVLADDPHGRYDYGPQPDTIRERVGQLRAVCERHAVALASAALQFPLGHPAVVSVIPGVRAPREVRSNVEHYELRAENLLPADVRVPT